MLPEELGFNEARLQEPGEAVRLMVLAEMQRGASMRPGSRSRERLLGATDAAAIMGELQ